MLYQLLKPAVFRLDPEQAHDLAIAALEKAGGCAVSRAALRSHFQLEDPRLAQEICGIRFPNPMGMAAGFDKNARAVPALAALGFGFVEIGTVTPRPQPGNPKPRIFRLPDDGAIINRMGFPNDGAEMVAGRLARLGRQPVPIGINLGKNKLTALEDAAQDYVAALDKLFPYGDYCVVNVSSPNTPGLRLLQGADYLRELMAAVQAANRRLAGQHGRPPLPVFLKIAPDLAPEDLEAIGELAVAGGSRDDGAPGAQRTLIDGLIATNTTLGRDGLRRPADEAGGLSGQPLRARSTEVIRTLARITRGAVPLIGAGGVSSGLDAYEKIRAGASLVQVYTGFIYAGPEIARRIKRELLNLLDRDGFGRVAEAVGADQA
ncbi:quinone-dependent dihydroorotate dehydrogenase [Thermithiobacillus tepidarius DSM 3134]|uniref:quinone-dependent dihydroorotate dehydrogenase n=1 Tax=Thermithiobacillus tepidarius TaxID=929 RepID=UPI000422D76E|nr:quinone-dependent dihydroorotate dehydrogenase [Thermithiobacillus tepidarius]